MKASRIIKLDFKGFSIFSEGKNYLFNAPDVKAAGVYLWKIRQRNDATHMIHYVGEINSFAKRLREHLINILGLNYGILNPDKAQDGISELIWHGL